MANLKKSNAYIQYQALETRPDDWPAWKEKEVSFSWETTFDMGLIVICFGIN
jgi:hypothetical protein